MDLKNPEHRRTIIREFAEVINRNNLESPSNTPDFALGEYLVKQLEAYNEASRVKAEYWGERSLPKNQSHANNKQPFFRR